MPEFIITVIRGIEYSIIKLEAKEGRVLDINTITGAIKLNIFNKYNTFNSLQLLESQWSNKYKTTHK